MDAITTLKIKNEKDAYGALLSVLGPNHSATLESAARLTDILTYEYRYREDDSEASSLLKDMRYYGEIAYNGLIKKGEEAEFPIGNIAGNYSALLLETGEFEKVLSVAEDCDKLKLRDFDYENWFEVSVSHFISLTQLGRKAEAEIQLEEVQEEIMKEGGYSDFRFGKTFLLYYMLLTGPGKELTAYTGQILKLMDKAGGLEDTVSYHIIAILRDLVFDSEEMQKDFNYHMLSLGKILEAGEADEDELDFCTQCLTLFLPLLPSDAEL